MPWLMQHAARWRRTEFATPARTEGLRRWANATALTSVDTHELRKGETMSFQPSAPRKRRRWAALLVIVLLATGAFASTALAAPTFTFTVDDQGANDEPGQKDLTAQSSAVDGGNFYTAWKWDDIAWNGNNTGDGCSLFDTDSDGLVNYAVVRVGPGQEPRHPQGRGSLFL